MTFRFTYTGFLFSLISFTTAAQNENRIDTAKVPSDSSLNKIFEKVDIEASFPGGIQAWRSYLEKKLNGAVATDNGAPVGLYKVWVEFIVDKDGSLSEIKPLSNLGYGMEKEVVRIIKLSDKWVPAMHKGRPVRAYRKQPVSFMTIEDGFDITTEKEYSLFAGIENTITISVRNVKPKDLRVTISQGTITSIGDGSYIVHVGSPGRVTIEVHNTKNKKDSHIASLEVIQPLPVSNTP